MAYKKRAVKKKGVKRAVKGKARIEGGFIGAALALAVPAIISAIRR